jgi:hypothetical protein
MPNNRENAIRFLETQWSSINANKVKGIEAEVRFENHLNTAAMSGLYQFIIPEGWIISPGNIRLTNLPTKNRIAILPIPKSFTWSGAINSPSFSGQVLAHSYFQQADIKVYFAECSTILNAANQSNFAIPTRGSYLRSYDINFKKVGAQELVPVPTATVMNNFAPRMGARGMRAYALQRINRALPIWIDNQIVTNLFWKDYVRYFLQRYYVVSNNDLDFFLVSNSGRSYPVEFKSKTAANDSQIGDWFGIDVGPFAKLSYFISLSNNMDAIYVVEEVDVNRNTLDWWAIKFSNLLKGCSWVQQSGGAGMGGGRSATLKVPKAIFTQLNAFLSTI